ncbi:MAG: hypothetical protein KDC35_07895 [Acidobacteria bacterium]|nr:hypothetical protein [Acidobacteriota bacterium]
MLIEILANTMNIACLMTTLVLFAWQQPGEGFSDFRHITSEDGLSQSTVWCIKQDQQGFMWFGTEDGLNKHDGYRFAVYRQSIEGGGLTDNRVLALAMDSRGFLWAGTKNGLNRIDPITMAIEPFFAQITEGLSANYIRCLLEAANGGLWIGTYEGGVCFFDVEKQRFYEVNAIPDTCIDFDVRALCEDAFGRIWVGTNEGLFGYLDDEDRVSLSTDQGLSHNQVRSLCASRDGSIWVGTTRGLNRLESETGRLIPLSHLLPPDHVLHTAWINTVREDERGHIWVGTVDGLWRVVPETGDSWQAKRDPLSQAGLSGNDVLDIYTDRTGLVWISTYQDGLNVMDTKPRKFALVKRDPRLEHSISGERVHSLMLDRKNRIWVGTDVGLDVSDDLNTFRHVAVFPDVAQSRTSTSVMCLVEDGDGEIWIGTYYGGLHRLNPETGRLTRYVKPPAGEVGLSDNTIQTLFAHSDGRIWVGTRQGLCAFDKREDGIQWIDPLLPNGERLSSRSIKSIEEGDGATWLGTYTRGLLRLSADGSELVQLSDKGDEGKTLDHASVSCAYFDGATLWVGTAQGLNAVDPLSFRVDWIGRRVGVPVSPVHGIQPGSQGELWVSTNMGLFRLDTRSQTFKSYDITDGLQSNEFLEGSSFHAADGQLFFGGLAGFNHFKPDEIVDNQHVPNIIITAMKVHGNPVPFEQAMANGSSLEFRYDLNFITFEFAALDFTYPKNNEFSYQLEGVDGDWVKAGTRNFASYTQLPHGNYTFKVIGSNNDGVWNLEEKAVHFRIAPPIWKTWWAYILYAIGVIGLVMSIHFLRLRALKHTERELKRLVRERTHHLEETQKKLVETAHRAGMAEIATGVLHNVGNILNSTNICVDQARRLVTQSNLPRLKKANDMLKEMEDQLDAHPKGKSLIRFYETLADELAKEQRSVEGELEQLMGAVQMMREIIEVQHDYAQTGFLAESMTPAEIINEVLSLMHVSLERHGIEVNVDGLIQEPCQVTKTKIVNVVVNLIENAKDALECNVERNLPKRLDIEVRSTGDGFVMIKFTDNGCGIDSDSLRQIFTFGYTTKEKGHGYGLHTAANAMTEMGGSLTLISDGLGKGACAVLRIPLVVTDQAGTPASTGTAVQQ